jgi:hydrogenase nickel incorporation protein HypA/HybF
VHERALMDDLVRKLEALSRAQGGAAIATVRVRVGALSHLTPAHFREHFEHAVRGTAAEGAAVEAVLDPDTAAPHAQGVLLESVDVEV